MPTVRSCRRFRHFAILAVIATTLFFRESQATWSMHWADQFYVGAAWAHAWGTAGTTGAARNSFAGTYLSWAHVGGQTYGGRANARERSGYTIEDRSSTKCFRVWMYLTRWRTDNGGDNRFSWVCLPRECESHRGRRGLLYREHL